MNLNDKKFKSLETSENGEVSSETTFHYRQMGQIIYATYSGGEIKHGVLSGFRMGDELRFHYNHENQSGELMSGKCHTVVSMMNDKVLLTEKWEWTSGDLSKGESTLLEI